VTAAWACHNPGFARLFEKEPTVSAPSAKFCLRCGGPLVHVEVEDRLRLRCRACGWTFYGNPTPVVAALVEHGPEIILVRNVGWPEKWFGLVSGFLEANERPDQGVLREVREELGCAAELLAPIGSYAFPERNEVILAYHVRALGEPHPGPELAEVKRVPVEKLKAWAFGTGHAVRDWLAARKPSGPFSKPSAPLAGAGWALRPWKASDLPAIVAACQDPEIHRWTRVPVPYGEDDAREYLAATARGWMRGCDASFAIVDPESDALLGAVDLVLRGPQTAEVGYWLCPSARGRGVMTGAVRALVDWGFATAGLERIQLQSEPENGPSLRVAERAGFVREGLLRRTLPLHGELRDGVMFARVR
jgi:RimJ/RimL family protein N-acetyltransferase/ADP-ribose pyrophosphatase YjhB (NUDIX family)